MVRLRTPEFRGKVSYVFTEQGGKPPCLSPTSEGSSFERFYFQDLISASLVITIENSPIRYKGLSFLPPVQSWAVIQRRKRKVTPLPDNFIRGQASRR